MEDIFIVLHTHSGYGVIFYENHLRTITILTFFKD